MKSKRPIPLLYLGGILLIAVATGELFKLGQGKSDPATRSKSSATDAPTRSSEAPRPARQLTYEVVNSYPHDPTSFLQGLLWHNGGFYESTGLPGRSSLRRLEFPSGNILQTTLLAPEMFGEGLALVDKRLVQLTWQNHRGFVYDLDTFRPLKEFKYETEGWGLAFDGKNLVMSDGTDVLTYLDAESFQPLRRLTVKMDGRPVPRLNELEFIEGEIWANVWQTDLIVLIDPKSGRVGSVLDLKGVLPREIRTGSEDVLNGIAYDAQQKRIFVSGKFWPRIFEIKVKPR